MKGLSQTLKHRHFGHFELLKRRCLRLDLKGLPILSHLHKQAKRDANEASDLPGEKTGVGAESQSLKIFQHSFHFKSKSSPGLRNLKTWLVCFNKFVELPSICPGRCEISKNF